MNAEQFKSLLELIDTRLNAEAEARAGSMFLGEAKIMEEKAELNARRLLVDTEFEDVELKAITVADDSTFPLFPMSEEA